jgi:hypothetical protein
LIAWFALIIGAAGLAVWSVVFLDNRLRSRASRSSSTDVETSWTSVYWIICLAWSFGVMPSLLGLLQAGRQGNEFATNLPTTATQARLATLLSTAIVFLCCRLIIAHLHDAPAASIWRLAAFLAPWFAIQLLSGIGAGYLSGRQFFFYPLIAVAFWLTSPPVRLAATVGVLAALTATFSIVFALVSPGLALVNAGSAGTIKAIVGHGPFLLAGPYNSSNGLALSLALGAPCLLLVRSPVVRLGGLTVIGVALLWAAGRTSILALTIGMAVYAVTRGRSPRALQMAGSMTMVVGAALVVLTPLREHNPEAFTRRGIIWILSLSNWRHHHLWFGGGPLYYERDHLSYYGFSFKIVHGHNLMVDTLARGGLVALVGVIIWSIALARQSLRLVGMSAFPVVFLITLLFASWLEVPVNLSNLGQLGYACWLPLAVICFAQDHKFASVPAGVRDPHTSTQDDSRVIYARR